VKLRMEFPERVGVLKDILNGLSDHPINVSNARVRTSPGSQTRIGL
jgi:guanosine-3',5'-bis(diphosphate) 3'-pyrophosphohydrolase